MNHKKVYKRIGKFRIDEVLPFVVLGKTLTKLRRKGIKPGSKEWKAVCQKEYLGYMINMSSLRYRVFINNGLKCANCGIEGSFFYLERAKKDKTGSYHFNLYAINKEGNEVLMTKDHIIPKSKGGGNGLENLQTMCVKCNHKKANSM
jgi:hypothetical protein